jgi:NADP-dependent 3-hydroxy acid dehydrogenase YdfG
LSGERKILLLTGSSRGIRHATAKRFGEVGWRIVIGKIFSLCSEYGAAYVARTEIFVNGGRHIYRRP